MFAGLGLVAGSGADAAVLVAGVGCGSVCWWALLTSVVAALRTRVTNGALTWVDRISGAVILAFAIAAIVSSLAA